MDIELQNIDNEINNKTILITGGTGTFGYQMTETLLQFKPKQIIILSRDELKQSEMKKHFNNNLLKFVIADIKDKDSLNFKNVDIIFHAAALKHINIAEENPFETIKTNILGSQNVIDKSIYYNVKKIIFISTDKAVEPTNIYGSTKFCAEKLFINASLNSSVKIAVVRYGNVFCSRGSVIPLFINQAKQGKTLTVTDRNMTRFNMIKQDAINFVLNSLNMMIGGEIFVPILKKYNLFNLAAMFSDNITIIGNRGSEKLHELMISKVESQNTIKRNDFYVIIPHNNDNSEYTKTYGNAFCNPQWEYSSNEAVELTRDDVIYMINNFS